VDLAILLGTDFNPDGFQGVGPVRALKFIRQYKRLEEIPELKEAISAIDYNSIRNIFLEPPAQEGVKPQWGRVNREKVISFLVDEHSFSLERVEAAMKRLVEVESTRSESLEKWLG